MKRETIKLGACSFEILSEGQHFIGLGKIAIGRTEVRSGRLPLRPFTQSFKGSELSELKLLQIDQAPGEVRIKTEAVFRPLAVKLMRDHSFDPIHETGDWDAPRSEGTAKLDLVLKTAKDQFSKYDFEGFSYHYEYASTDVPVFYLLDQATWELGGDIVGATAISQSSCSAPSATFEAGTQWSTEGRFYFGEPNDNPVMTHNLPRWASHGSFDFQYNGNQTLLGVFERVDLIRSLLMREPNKAELKTFDKHIFDQTLNYKTSAKSILLNTDRKSPIDQRNLWTWVFDEIHDRARAEYGFKEEPLTLMLAQNFWQKFTIDSYYKDLVPAAINLGVEAIFIDNVNKSAMTEQGPLPGVFNWNMCCGHEYEVSPKLGGPEALKKLVDSCREHGIEVFPWTNNDQALSSPYNRSEREDGKFWYVALEDTRQKWGGAYMGCMSVLNFKTPDARNYWVNGMRQNMQKTGVKGIFFDSFYNLGFFPVSYSKMTPTTQWRELLLAFKELQDEGAHFRIESFGPFGLPMHGCPADYGKPDQMFAAYKLKVSLGYVTVPHPGMKVEQVDEAEMVYRCLAHMTDPGLPLHVERDGKHIRIDEAWGEDHKRAIRDYTKNRNAMQRRFLQEDGNAVIWHDRERTRATVWNFVQRSTSLPGKVTDVSTGRVLPQAASYTLEACHTYSVTETDLPIALTK